ncbi:uncharacterized protein PG998_008451 [Apiospora kogelbergensis]
MDGLRDASFDFASFAIYNLAGNVTDARLAEIANIPQEQWEEAGMDNHCVKPATPTANFAGKSLEDVITAHITTAHQDITPGEDGSTDEASWWPYVFIVVTNDKIEDHGLLLVYIKNPFAEPATETSGGAGKDRDGVDNEDGNDDDDADEEDEEKPEFAKFFFKSENMYKILAGICLRDEDIEELQADYEMDE